ncbi:MAG: hypothetical protein ACRYHQ_15280 [Janthinobacterium lividum]
MDTHFEQNLPRSSARPELSLPGENEQISTLHAEPKDRIGTPHVSDDAAESEPKTAQDAAAQSVIEANAAVPAPDAVAPEPAAKTANKRRSSLMTSAAVSVTLMAAAGVFLISPYNHIIPLNLAALQGNRTAPPGATQSIAIPAPIAPSAKLARAPSPQATPAPNRPIASSRPRADEMREIVNLRPGSSTREAPASDKPAEDRQAAAPTSVASVEAPAAQSPIITQAPAIPVVSPAPVLQPVPTPTPARPTVTASAPTDPVVVAATLQASPMSTPQQIDVLNVVTELGTLLRNQRAENAQLRDDVQQMRERLDTQLNDYARRLSLAEARGAINAAMGVGTPAAAPSTNPGAVMPASITVLAPMPVSAGGASRGARATTPALAASLAPVAAQDAPRRYRVQAASPGLAMLAEVDRTGDAGNMLQVSIGDDVPGYGKVKSIAQQGAAWVLTAERGTIR